MTKRNDSREQFEQRQLEQLALQMQYRDWTAALLKQRLTALDEKLAAGDMPILDAGERGHLPLPDLNPVAVTTTEAEQPEDDYTAFMEG